jgi:hypothetical protein
VHLVCLLFGQFRRSLDNAKVDSSDLFCSLFCFFLSFSNKLVVDILERADRECFNFLAFFSSTDLVETSGKLKSRLIARPSPWHDVNRG